MVAQQHINYTKGACFDSNSNKVVVVYQGGTPNGVYAKVGTISSSNRTISFGGRVSLTSTHSNNVHCCFDSNSNKVVAFAKAASAGTGNAWVGTVSGTSISFGSAVTFGSNNTNYIQSAFDSNDNKVIVSFTDGNHNNQIATRVGTVSGTSITFGYTKWVSSGYATHPSLVWDSNANKMVVFYKDNSASDYGKSAVCTMNDAGTSSSYHTYGTIVNFHSGAIGFAERMTMACFDSNANKIVIIYNRQSANWALSAVVGTVTGTSISFGTTNSGITASYSTHWHPVFDTNANKVVLFYKDGGNSSWGSVKIGTVSGTTISFGSATTNLSNSLEMDYPGGAFDSNTNKTVFLSSYYQNGAAAMNAFVWENAYTSENLTSSNFIGISNGAYANAATATIQTNRATDNAQSGLTAGSTYYAQTDGTLSTTADSPSVLVGTARTTTSIKIKGSNA
jgi:hypothetical protein